MIRAINHHEQDLEIAEVTDPVELAALRRAAEDFERNRRWQQAHAQAIYDAHRGQYVCIAGQEIFVGDTDAQARQRAGEAHPNDHGRYSFYVQPVSDRKVIKVYAHQRPLETVR
ncbi:MAG: hypothetical protein WD768_05600 [Phycisphaeraceae bacterium]